MFILNSVQENSNELYRSPKGKNILLMPNAGEIGLKTHTQLLFVTIQILTSFGDNISHLNIYPEKVISKKEIGSSSDVCCIGIYNNKNLSNSRRTVDKIMVSQIVVTHVIVNNVNDKGLLKNTRCLLYNYLRSRL